MCQRSRRMIWTTTTRGPSGQALASSSLPQTGLATRSCSLASPCSLTPQACPKTSTQQMLFGSRTCEHAAKLWRPAAADRSFSPPSSSSFVLQVPTKQAVHLRRTLQWSAPPRNCLAQLPRPMRRWYAVQRKCFSTMKTAKTHPQRAPSPACRILSWRRLDCQGLYLHLVLGTRHGVRRGRCHNTDSAGSVRQRRLCV